MSVVAEVCGGVAADDVRSLSQVWERFVSSKCSRAGGREGEGTFCEGKKKASVSLFSGLVGLLSWFDETKAVWKH